MFLQEVFFVILFDYKIKHWIFLMNENAKKKTENMILMFIAAISSAHFLLFTQKIMWFLVAS